ncbi:MAG TPA: GAF domain-containing protein, partial [Ktedonobacteraceae bacterium]|nr:GAF domain-containing protein [Ktedonobacteraceae bacterium]
MEAQTLRAVSQISARLVRIPGRHGDLNSLLQHIAEVAQEAFLADACVVLAFNPLTGGFTGARIVVGDVEVKDESLHDRPRPKGVTQQILREGVVLVENLEEKLEKEPWYQNRFLAEEGIHCFAGLAMRTRHRQKPLGVIYLDYRQLRSFTLADRESFQLFAVQAGLLLQEAWLENHLEEVARIGQEINHDLATVDDLFQHLQTYVDAILDDSHMLMLAIYQPQSNTADIHVRAQGTYTFMNRPLGGATKYIIESQEAFSIQHLSEEKDQLPFQIVNVTGTKEREALIFVPLTLRDLPLGVLSIQHPLPNTYGQEDLFILQLLANYIALALHNMRLYRSLTQLNETGQLLTSQLESEQTLQATVDKIRAAAQADLVVLYAFNAPSHRFVLPPRIAGTMLDTSFPRVTRLRPDDITTKALSCAEPIFAKESMSVYTELGGQAQIRPGNFREREKIASIALLPLRVGDESVGVLFVNFRQAQRFDATQKLLIEGLAHYAAISIKNSQVFGSLSLRRVRELEILQKIDRELAHTLELDTVLNTILRLTRRQVSADEASIALYNAQAQVLESIATLGQHASERHNLNIPVQDLQGITRWVLEHKRPALVANVQLDQQWKDVYVQTTGTTLSALHVPLLDGDEVVGVMSFESSKEGAFHQEDQDFLLTLAGQTILAIKTAQAYEREKRLADERQVLNDISKEITSQLDYVRIFNLILDKALALTHSTVGSVHLYDPDSRTLNMEAERGVGEERKRLRQQLGEGIVGRVAKRRELLSVNDVTRSPWNEFFVEFFPGTRSELTVPMLAGDELRGVLNVESPHPNNYTGRDKRLLQGLADLAVVALQNAQAFEGEKRLVAEGKVLNDISK